MVVRRRVVDIMRSFIVVTVVVVVVDIRFGY